MYSYFLELAKRPFNVLSSRTYCTTPSAHLISFSLDPALCFCLFGFLKAHAAHAQYLACFYIYIQVQKNMVFLSL